MSQTDAFLTGEAIIALLFAMRSRFLRRRLTLLLWGIHAALSLAVLKAPNTGAWETLMHNPSPGTMLTIAVTTLALLLFTANLFHGSAIPNNDPESYFGVPLDTYMSVRPWVATLLLSPSLHAMTAALFVLPVFTPMLDGWTRIATAAWCAALGLVFAILLLNLLDVLRTSLIRQARRRALPLLVEDEFKASFQREFRNFAHGTRRGSVQELVRYHAKKMARLPIDQQTAYFVATVGQPDADHLIDARCNSARVLASSTQSWRQKWRWAMESMRGNFGQPGQQALTILDTIDRIERNRAAALADSVDAFGDPQVRERILSQLVNMALAMHRRWTSLQEPSLSQAWVGPQRPLTRQAVHTARHWRACREPEVLTPVMAILERVIELRFPFEREAQCSTEELADLARALRGVTHIETRRRLMNLFAERAIRSTIVSRHPDEALPMNIVREALNVDTQREDDRDDLRRALRSAAFAAADSYASEEQRKELLRYLDQIHVTASLIHALMYRCRSHRALDVPLLRPYVKHFDEACDYTSLYNLDREALYELCRHSIDHFFRPSGLNWMLDSLRYPVDSELITRHMHHQRETTPDFTLTTFLLWHGTVQDISYSHGDVSAPPELPDRWWSPPGETVRSAAAILDELHDGRGRRLLSNNPWVHGESEPQ